MNHFKKQFFLVLFILCAGLFAAGSASAQTWQASDSSILNVCTTGANGWVTSGQSGKCYCNAGYTMGVATGTNCNYDGAIRGCWNPSSGKCQACGSGGTVSLGLKSCFNSGQGNQGGNEPAPVGVSCTVPAGSPSGSSPNCISSNTSSGGFSTN
jgi:hypothetical protein